MAGRPKKAANKANGVIRPNVISFRCSHSFNEIVNHLVQSKQYKSKADVIHEAVQILALKKVTDDAFKHRINTI